MFKQRVLVIVILVPIILLLVIAGSWILYIPVALVLGVISWEYWTMFQNGGYKPSAVMLIAGNPLIFLSQAFFGFSGRNFTLTLLLLSTLALYIFLYDREQDHAVINLSLTITGLLCIGWLSTYLIPVRNAQDGLWWTTIILLSVTFGDAGGYIIGNLFGRHKLCRRISPGKTWEGYIGGIVFATLATWIAASIWQGNDVLITPVKSALFGFILSAIIPLGDLSVSLFKRTFGLKDTSNLIPGHGGFWDRFDTFLWAIFIGYFLMNSLWCYQYLY